MSFQKEVCSTIINHPSILYFIIDFIFNINDYLQTTSKPLLYSITLILRNISYYKINRSKIISTIKLNIIFDLCVVDDEKLLTNIVHFLWSLCHCYQQAIILIKSSKVLQILSEKNIESDKYNDGLKGLLCVCKDINNN